MYDKVTKQNVVSFIWYNKRNTDSVSKMCLIIKK